MKGFKKKIRDNRYLNWLLLVSNWLFQGIRHSDTTEKVYKILFTLLFWIIFYLLFQISYGVLVWQNIAYSFLIAHTLNWVINGNISMLLIHNLLLVKLSKQDLFRYMEKLEAKTKNQDWILYAASFGSICRGDLKDSSDIDISIVRKPGFKNALKSIWFALKEKKKADLKAIPLEIYISDSPQDSIKRFGAEKNPVVICDEESTISKYYEEQLSLQEARTINNVL